MSMVVYKDLQIQISNFFEKSGILRTPYLKARGGTETEGKKERSVHGMWWYTLGYRHLRGRCPKVGQKLMKSFFLGKGPTWDIVLLT